MLHETCICELQTLIGYGWFETMVELGRPVPRRIEQGILYAMKEYGRHSRVNDGKISLKVNPRVEALADGVTN
jgi:hypothetical protein